MNDLITILSNLREGKVTRADDVINEKVVVEMTMPTGEKVEVIVNLDNAYILYALEADRKLEARVQIQVNGVRILYQPVRDDHEKNELNRFIQDMGDRLHRSENVDANYYYKLLTR
jgi:DNA-binding transcriptional regulator GbsR (MarR family)